MIFAPSESGLGVIYADYGQLGSASPTPSSKAWVSERRNSSTQMTATPDPCPFFIPERIPGAPNLIPYGRLISLAEIREAMGYRQ